MAVSVLARGVDYNLLISRRADFRAVIPVPRAWCPMAFWGNAMNLPKIDISTLPDLDKLTGVFGSLANPFRVMESDDTAVIIMVFVYDIIHP
jgi:hypothetical protein